LHIDDAENADTRTEKLSRLFVFGGDTLDRFAHFVDGAVGAESDFGAHSDFFEKFALAADGSDAQVRPAEIDSDGKIGHG